MLTQTSYQGLIKLFIIALAMVFIAPSYAQGSRHDLPMSPMGTLPQEEEEEEEGYLINFPNVHIIEYIRFISQISNKNFIYKEADLQFSVSILSEEPTSIKNIMSALVQILRIHGLSLLEQGNNMIIHTNPSIAQVPPVTLDPSSDTGIVTRVFQLKNVNPASIKRIIRPMVSAGSLVEVSEETRHLIVTDIGTNVDEIDNLLKELDSPNITVDIGSYSARHSHIDSLVEHANKIMAPLIESNPFVLVPQTTSGTIFIVSTPYLINRTMAVLGALDIPSEGTSEEELPSGHIDKTNFYIHKMQYHLGDTIMSALKSIADGLASDDSQNTDLISTIRSAQWLDATNSLIFTGANKSLKKVRELIDNLDVPLRQVFIEMLIIDTTVSNSLDFGVDWAATIKDSEWASSTGNLTGTGSNVPAALPLLPPDASSLLVSEGFSFGIIGRTITHGNTKYSSLGALVHALEKDADVNILLNPKIITQDTSTAELFVGGTSAFQSSSSVNNTGDVITVNVEERDVGTSLQVTPILGPEDVITLDIKQEMSEDLSSNATLTTGQSTTLGPRTTKSSTKTRVHIPDRNFLIISGMIRESITTSKTAIPCLGSIPVVGQSLFGSQKDSSEKRNLMIFIRPHIVTTLEEAEALTQKQKNNYYKGSTKKGQFIFDLEEYMNPYNP